MAYAKSVEAWFDALDPSLRLIALGLRQLVLRVVPDMTESIKWGNLVYEKGGKVCYLAAGKGYVSLGFFQGARLVDSHGLIEGTGKSMRHVKVRHLGEQEQSLLAQVVQDAVALNSTPS